MTYWRRAALGRVTVLVLTAVVLVLLAGGAFFGHKWRKRAMVARALTDGLAAYEQQDWETARIKLGQYLSVHRDKAAILAKYADAQLSVTPLPEANISQAIGAYRRLLRVNPADDLAFRRLALLYETIGDFAELAHVAEKKLESRPGDPAAIVAQARSLLYRQKPTEARNRVQALVEADEAGEQTTSELADAHLLLAEIALQSGAADALWQALTILDTAVTRHPDAALVRVQRAAVLRLLARGAAPDDAARLAEARTELERAAVLGMSDPRVVLMVAREWLNLGDKDRAAVALDAAARLSPEQVRTAFINPHDWFTARFLLAANLSLVTGNTEEGVRLADEAVNELAGRRQRLAMLPVAVHLFLAGGEIDRARGCLTEYTEALRSRQAATAERGSLALLEAMVAAAENRPYAVIDLLEPLARKGEAPASAETLLAQAYSRTGQSDRLLAVLGRDRAGDAMSPALALQLARAYYRQGNWTRSLATLAALHESRSATPEVERLRLGAELGQAFNRNSSVETIEALMSELRDLRDAYPEPVEIRVLLATAEELRGRREVAQAELTKAIADCPEPLLARLALARLHTAAKRPDDALEVLRAACREHRQTAAPWLALAELLSARRQHEAARAELETASGVVADPQERRRIDTRLALLEVGHGDQDAGVAALRQLAADDPRDLRVRALLLEIPAVVEDAAVAQPLIDEIKSVEGETGLLWRLGQARVWLTDRNWHSQRAQIEELLRYCVEANPRSAAPVLLLGAMCEQFGELSAAETVYTTGLAASSAPAVADRLLAVLQRQRRFADAHALLERVQDKLSRQALDARRLALALEEGNYDEAISELQMRLSQPQQNPADLIRLARLTYSTSQDADQAFAYLDQAAALGAAPEDLARMRVFILEQEQRSDEAVAILDALVREYETSAALLVRASYHAAAGRAVQAEEDYTEAADLAEDESGYATLGEFYARSGRLDEAIDAWQAGLGLFPDSTALKRGLCKVYLMRGQDGDRQGAEAMLNDLRKKLGSDTELIWIEAMGLVGQRSPEAHDRARALLTDALQAVPAGPEAYLGLVNLAIQLREPETARALALRGLQIHPGNIALRVAQAAAELALDHPNTAADLAREVLDQAPQNTAAQRIVLEVASRQGNDAAMRDALATLTQLYAAAPHDEEICLLTAQTHAALGELDAAATVLEQYRPSEPGQESVPVQVMLARVYRDRGDMDAAWTQLEFAAAVQPDHPGVLSVRLALLAVEGKFDEIAALAEAETRKPQPDLAVLLEAATLLSGQPKGAELALKLCMRVTELAPDLPTAQSLLGELQYRLGNLDAAAAAYRAVLRRDPADADALNNLAWVLASKSSPDADTLTEALSCARKAVEQAPTFTNFRDTLAFTLKKMPGRQDEARKEYLRLADLAPPESAARARALFEAARLCMLLNDPAPVTEYLDEARHVQQTVETSGGPPIFTESEKQEIAQLLDFAQHD